MLAEINFLEFSQRVCPEFTPRLYKIDKARGILLLEYVSGDYFKENKVVRKKELNFVIEFYKKLNCDLKLCKAFIKQRAVDGFLDYHEHLSNIEFRLKKFGSDHLPNSQYTNSADILTIVRKKWTKIKNNYERKLNCAEIKDSVLPAKYLQVSPSDFGFHNAIRTTTGIKFFDFEFSGWDDPAKTICDFFNQPKIGISQTHIDWFINHFAIHCPKDVLSYRIKVLYPLMKFKWVCIILNFLDREKFEALSVRGEQADILINSRLLIAKKKLEEL